MDKQGKESVGLIKVKHIKCFNILLGESTMNE